ncbi:TPA: ISLre2 family transposase [Streptococcus pyogenes]|nr:ISLre2 family transposase [Streptococcus pyogenes]
MAILNKEGLQQSCLEASQREFLKKIRQYDEQMRPIMKARGYTYIQSMERTVAFVSVGEVRFKRRRYRKNGEWSTPVDEALGLKKNSRYSEEMIQMIAKCALEMSYAKTAKLISEIYGISLSSTTVNKVIREYHDVIEQQKDYRFFKENNSQKRHVPVIYIEGDGVMLKAKKGDLNSRRVDLSHFVVHEGVKKGRGKRLDLKQKHEVISFSSKEARRKVLDYLSETYEITKDTLLITNSDGGHGYTPYVFKELAKALKVKRHEHFYDGYHVTQMLKQAFKSSGKDLLEQSFKAIHTHDKQELREVFEQAERLNKEVIDEGFLSIKNKLLNNFQYTKPAHLRGLEKRGIGVMESQHRKITYRMKRRGMYWTKNGIETISQLILFADEKKLDDFFSGKWREEYEKFQALDELSADHFKGAFHEAHTLPKARQDPYVSYKYYR